MMEYILPAIPFLRLRFAFIAREDTFLPQFKGSMLRGAFGNALRHTVCVMKPQQNCDDCMLRQQCVYTRIFETFIQGQPPPFLKGLQTSPRPFIIDALDQNKEYSKGDSLTFALTLLGRAWELHPYVIFAFHEAAQKGLTARNHPFHLQCVQWLNAGSTANGESEPQEWKLLYEGETQTLVSTPKLSTVRQDYSITAPVTLKFITPTRLKFNNYYSMDFSFRQLVFKMLCRTLEIAHFHVPDAAPDWDFHDYLVAANEVHITSRNLHWQDWHRYSNRQKTEMAMGGFVGQVDLDGNVELFSDLLRLSEVLHIGKGTVFGLGKVEV